MDRSLRVTFIHTPRTGGTSVNQMVSANLPAEQVLLNHDIEALAATYDDRSEFDAAFSKKLDTSRYASYHGSIKNARMNQPARKVVLSIRSPVERAFSLYTWWRRYDIDLAATSHEFKGIKLARELSFRDFCLHKDLLINNHDHVISMSEEVDLMPELVTQDILTSLADRAIKNLDEIDWILETGSLDEDYIGLFYFLGFPPTKMASTNASTALADRDERAPLASEDLEAVEASMTNELRFYHAARARRERLIELTRHEDIERHCLERWLVGNNPVFYEAGWHRMETALGVECHWLGESVSAGVLIRRERCPAPVRIRILKVHSFPMPLNISCSDDHIQYPVHPDSVREIVVMIDGENGNNGSFARLEFNGPLGKSSEFDARKLSYLIAIDP